MFLCRNIANYPFLSGALHVIYESIGTPFLAVSTLSNEANQETGHKFTLPTLNPVPLRHLQMHGTVFIRL